MATTNKMNTRVSRAFKMHGLLPRGDTVMFLVQSLSSLSLQDLDGALERILDSVKKQPLSSNVIELSTVEAAFKECTSGVTDETENVFNIIGAFDIPRFVYNQERKKFLPIAMTHHPQPNLLGSPQNKAEIFRERFCIIQQCMQRHELFSPAPISTGNREAKTLFQLRTVEFLLGTTTNLKEVILLGMLTQIKEGKFYLEDPTGTVQLDLQNVQHQHGLFTECCCILAEGRYDDGVFHVIAMGLPPIEYSRITRAHFGFENFFGGPSALSVKASDKLARLEEQREDVMFVLLSDVWLDHFEVLEKLRIIFTGYSPEPPTCFILCGNFSSKPYGPNYIKTLRESFKTLGTIISEFPDILQRSRFVFIPGPDDPGPGTILPRPPLADFITTEFTQQVPSAVFATNPSRIQYCTQEIVVFRENLVSKMCRNCIQFPSDKMSIPNHFVRTILSQAHLTPLPLSVSPVHWAYDFALSIYPLPDMIVFADTYDPFNITHNDCICVNPGSFSSGGFCFKVYYPSKKHIEDRYSMVKSSSSQTNKCLVCQIFWVFRMERF
uniref:DNA polymerase epsilon subunit n=1 Tax=Eptatretus burgeri TaxID=7764 RepID=A0A8C4QTQ8_EPTBU